MKKLVITLIVFVAAGAIYWTYSHQENVASGPGATTERAARTVPVTVANANVMSFAERIEAIGTARANESVNITAKVTDKISRIDFEDGQYVEKGALLVELTNDEQTAQLSEAKADRDDARRQLRRIEELVQQNTVSASQVDEARARYSIANARLEGIIARLKDRVVRAPFSGVLGFRQVSPGTLVSPGTVITTLDDVSTLKLDFSVPELFLGVLDIGDPVTAASPAFREEKFRGTVTGIGSRVDEVTRSVTVRAMLPNEARRLRPGMLMTVELKAAERTALAVPEAAVVPAQQDAYVYVINNESVAVRRAVTTGQRSGGMIEITSGLQEGEQVAVLGLVNLRNGVSVSIAGPAGS